MNVCLENDMEKVKVFLAKHIWWEMSWKNDRCPLFTTEAAKTSERKFLKLNEIMSNNIIHHENKQSKFSSNF